MKKSRYKYLRAEDIRRLGSFEFAPKAVAEGYLAGRHTSHRQGASTEFRDYRQYVPGDDPALIDWKIYARTDRYYLHTYEQETNLDCHIFLDSSASMGFGHDITKLDYASFFAAALSYLVIHNNDRVSLQLFDDKIRAFYPPGSTGRHLDTLLHALEKNVPGEPTSVSQALRRAYPLLKRKGTLVVISDFFDDAPAIFSALSPYIHRGFRIHLFHIMTPEELDLEKNGLVTFRDMESGERVPAHSGNLREEYRKVMLRHIEALRTLAVRRRIDYVTARTDSHFFNLFDRFSQ